jgi:hypothetical protein
MFSVIDILGLYKIARVGESQFQVPVLDFEILATQNYTNHQIYTTGNTPT